MHTCFGYLASTGVQDVRTDTVPADWVGKQAVVRVPVPHAADSCQRPADQPMLTGVGLPGPLPGGGELTLQPTVT
tara:strand:- start:30971 stop:31195 length:225 start_codon:yes stop_codon:yes gene_type:complete